MTHWRGLFCALAMAVPVKAAMAQEAAPAPSARPILQSQRWLENWSVLANPAVPREPLDSLKYIPLDADPDTYISLGANIRERLVDINAPALGIGGAQPDIYLLDRFELHADMHVGNWQAFVQLADSRAPGKKIIGPADADRLDLEQVFLSYNGALGNGRLKLRAGRQEFAFDLQRFVSSRDGPNVRQAFDAVWADYETGRWRIITFMSQPVVNKNTALFDDYSNGTQVLDGIRVEDDQLGPGGLAVYYLRYEKGFDVFYGAAGTEIRNNLDFHYAGQTNHFDYDAEVIGQQGNIGGRRILAWAFGARSGYTFAATSWTPHLSLQCDLASGDRNRTGNFGTFNPLYPNGSYFTLADLTGDANLIHVKPILALAPSKSLTLQAAIGLQWRQTMRDAVYVYPVRAVPHTAGTGSSWTGVYFQLDAAEKINANLVLSAEYVHYQIGDTLRRAGGHNTDYANLQMSFAW